MGTQYISVSNMLAGSETIKSNNGIVGGGVDVDGSMDPSVKEAFEFSWE